MSPSSLLADTPFSFRGSAPRNFDMLYRGPVSARTALSNSLNAPAVRVLRMVGYPYAKTLLNMFGFEKIDRDPSYYTDSLALGGCETTLMELASAYRALASGGGYMPLRWSESGKEFSKRIISPEAAYLVTDILQDERRLAPIYQELFQEKNQSIAFKTGTSYGLRDAWCMGFTRNYTVGIWVGSPDGTGFSELVGMSAATPIMLKVAREIWDDSELPFERPPGVYKRYVCALSGELPTRNCPRTLSDLAIKDVTKIALCPLHKNIDGRVYIAWPPELKNWMRREENIAASNNPIKIIRPASGHTVVLRRETGTERIFLSAEGDAPHYWYLDGKFVGISPKGEGLFADVSSGNHRASVISGESIDTVSFEARTPQEISEALGKKTTTILN
jgi:penicillin-binding protein 1C